MGWNLARRPPCQISPPSAAEGPCDAFLKISKNSEKSQNSNFKILVHHFLRLCLPCIVKKLDSIQTQLTEEPDFEVCPYGDSGNGTAAAARQSAGYSDWTGGMASSDRSSGAFRTGGATGRKNQPACMSVCLLAYLKNHMYVQTSEIFCMWSWLAPHLTTMQHAMYFRFYG